MHVFDDESELQVRRWSRRRRAGCSLLARWLSHPCTVPALTIGQPFGPSVLTATQLLDSPPLQEVFMGSDSLPPVPAEQQPAAAVDTARIAVLPTDSLDDLKDVLLAVQ